MASRMRWRLWMLVIMLGLVVASMRQLSQPSTVRRLDLLFGVGEQTRQQPARPLLLNPLVINPLVLNSLVITPSESLADAPPTKQVAPPVASAEAAGNLPENDLTSALAAVEDNTYFRNAETEAWFGLFRRLQHWDKARLNEADLGDLTYAQLVKQPEFYRGQVVTIHGTLRREETKQPVENSLGIESYHRLVIEPRGGGNWPFMVYCLTLPEGFPRGDQLQAPVSVTGFFFKNLSYAWEDGLGIAPVVVASDVDWQPQVSTPTRRTITSRNAIFMLLVAGLFALLAVVLVLCKTRRSKLLAKSTQPVVFADIDSSTESIQERLQQLSAVERQE